MDFFSIKERSLKRGKRDETDIYPDFKVCRSKDLMVRGGAFYAIWDEEAGLWSTDEYDVQRLVDNELYSYAEKRRAAIEGIHVMTLGNFSSGSWRQFKNYLKLVPDSNHQLDERLTFSDTKVSKKDYISKRLPYPLEAGPIDAYNEIIGTLYDPEERDKLEWAIGSIVSGDSRDIQKFIVLYGEQGAGKSTILNIIQKLFDGYYTTFDAKSLASSNNSFSTEVFKSNPLVAIQHDGDLSRIEDNTKLNSIVSHELMTMNEKFKSAYTAKTNCFLFMATNKPVKITDAKSGIIRRLIDVKPSGRKLEPKRYFELVGKIDFELGGIAKHCLDRYLEMGKNYYSSYRPMEMIYKTDVFFNFVENYYDIFKADDVVTLSRAYDMYKQYCEDSLVDFKLPRHKFREEFKNYFRNFEERAYIEGKDYYSVYSGFLTDKFDFEKESEKHEEAPVTDISLKLECTTSLFDLEMADCLAQYASSKEKPTTKWMDVKTTLKDIDTSRLHYVKLPSNHIVVDFDLRDENGKKDKKKNLTAASVWPETYSEFSKSGGVHLHYIYDGDPNLLCCLYSEGIEIKVFTGNASLRRKLSKCNDKPIAHLNSGLPTKGEKVINFDGVKSERSLRKQIDRNLRKEIHPSTKPSVDFIYKILEDAYASGLKYDISDLKPTIVAFAASSTHQSDTCLKIVSKMHFKSEEQNDNSDTTFADDRFVFFDVEVFPNLFLVNWKYDEIPEDTKDIGDYVTKNMVDSVCHRMINPSSKDIEELFKYRLIGFNNRNYDNHILYACYLGYNNQQLYDLSQSIISDAPNCKFKEAYNISYTDVYDFSSKKQSLKKFEIELGIHHQELGLPWDKPVPEELWEKVARYCDNDVIATEAVFHARIGDWKARQILADVADMTVNDTTNTLTTRIIFGKERNPKLVYTDLATGEQFDGSNNSIGVNEMNCFPGYSFEGGKNMFRGENVGKGGYVYSKPGMYFGKIVTFDVASQHPHSILAMNCFGDYTQRFRELLETRIAIKHKDYEAAKKLLNGKLVPYLDDKEQAKALSQALKIAINSVYGLTSASFDNPFRDRRNANNIVALRGALFMLTLRDEVLSRGFEVVHIKTDSIKVLNPTEELSAFIFEFAQKYGYTFEIEHIFDRFCLVNDAVYIARLSEDDEDWSEAARRAEEDGADIPTRWTATGTQFQVPYVFKTIFSKEPVVFEDLCETKSVTTALYLDLNEGFPDVKLEERIDELRSKEKKHPDKLTGPERKLLSEWNDISEEELSERIAKGHDYNFVGKVGNFCPIKPGCGGGLLLREKDGKYYSATGATGYRWLDSETVRLLNKSDAIDLGYFVGLANDAVANISQYGDIEMFISDDEPDEDLPPWYPPCGDPSYSSCIDCSSYHSGNCKIGYLKNESEE